ncbi:hypothetical protein ES703_82337 [subsurface metagenome]
MAKVETEGQVVHIVNGETAKIFKVLANPDAVKILHLTGAGIVNSTYARDELCLPLKRYYTRLKALLDSGLVKKRSGVYIQTALGKIMFNRFLPAMVKAVDAKDKLELIMGLEGTELENDIKKRILKELGIPDFTDTTHLKLLGDYEALAIEVIDLYDSAEESVLLATNYFDVRVMEAGFRATERGVTNRYIVGKKSLSSKLQQLRMILSVTFAKTIINFTTNKVNILEFLRFIDLPYSFHPLDAF